jgi:NifU-like protein involved in Fe-S cluster formation
LTGSNVLTATVSSRLCGSQLILDAVLREGRVSAVGYQVRACSLGQAATALVAKKALGMNLTEIRQVRDCLQAILAGATLGADELPWPELAIFTHAVSLPTRHGAALLPFQALEQLLEEHS